MNAPSPRRVPEGVLCEIPSGLAERLRGSEPPGVTVRGGSLLVARELAEAYLADPALADDPARTPPELRPWLQRLAPLVRAEGAGAGPGEPAAGDVRHRRAEAARTREERAAREVADAGRRAAALRERGDASAAEEALAAERRRRRAREAVRAVLESGPEGVFVELSGYRTDSERHLQGAIDAEAPAGGYDWETHDAALAISERLGPGGAALVEIPIGDTDRKEIWSYVAGRLAEPPYRKARGAATVVHLHVEAPADEGPGA